jgi:hypothetical protein
MPGKRVGRDLAGRFEASKLFYDGRPESRAIELAMEAFWATATEEFKKIRPELSQMDSRKVIEESLAAHIGAPAAKSMMEIPRGCTGWNGFMKDGYKVKADEMPKSGTRSLP